MTKTLLFTGIVLMALPPATSATPLEVPDDFPRFEVPGQAAPMTTLRHLFYRHYVNAGPKATLWDEWLPMPSLWPAYTTPGSTPMRDLWRDVLTKRKMDDEGYVATHQHQSIAHQTGWPFPHWGQGHRGFGYHFSYKDALGPPWRPTHLATPDGWLIEGAESRGTTDEGWDLTLTTASASLTTPLDANPFLPFETPFIQLRWRTGDLLHAQPFIEWTTTATATFGLERRMYFDPPRAGRDDMTYTMVPMFRHPLWEGEITGLRLNFGNSTPTARVTLQAIFSQYDTRHNINNQSYLAGCTEYFWWSRDLNFLRVNITKMRTALQFIILDGQTDTEKVVLTGWVGHDGRTGLRARDHGTTAMLTGTGIGNNYWDLLPFGHKDTYATLRFYSTLLRMAQLEEEIAANPGWNLPIGVIRPDPAWLRNHAAEIKQRGNELFWKEDTGRFAACVDADGNNPDFGFTFVNLEAIYYGFATDDHARSILDWVTGKRVVQGDTSTGDDIYTWRFAPRATTRRNIDYYGWYWNAPASIDYGDQVQDGGAVLGFSFHDLMSRLEYLSPDDTWQRLQGILAWYDEVEAAGGYRKYYDGSRPGKMQGGGPPGGLGMDQEFFESVLVPQVMLEGFLGFKPTGRGFRLNPRLPSSWPSLTIDKIHLHDHVLQISATADTIEVTRTGAPTVHEACVIELATGIWEAEWAESPADQIGIAQQSSRKVEVIWEANSTFRLKRADLGLQSRR